MSTAYLSRWSGPVKEEEDPYFLPMPSFESPTDLSASLHVQNVTWLPPREESLDTDLLKRTVQEMGALYTAFDVNLSCFGQNVTDYHNGTNYYLPDEGYIVDGGHAVTLVGWDDNYPAANFTTTPPGDGAFIVKNSWGPTACDDGYLYISYYDASFARDYSSVLFTAEPADSLDNMYQYDPLGWTNSLGYNDTTCYGANVFTADAYEDLRAVSFYTSEPGTEYVVAIFRDIDTPPGNATGPVTWVSGTTAMPGYHTVPLTDAVALSPDQTFSVMLKVTAPTDIYPLVVEDQIENYSSQATAAPGQSYVSFDGIEWDDLTTFFSNTNICIKAFTTDACRVPTNYPTIQSAVDAARAGDTVIVESGTYHENVVINTSITLRGTDTGDGIPVIDACGNGSALFVTADSTTVENFVLTGGGEGQSDAGLYVLADNARIVNLSACQNAGDGIAIIYSENNTLTGCTCRDNTGNGIEVNSGPGCTLTSCVADDNGQYGICIYNSNSIHQSITNTIALSDNISRSGCLPDSENEGYDNIYDTPSTLPTRCMTATTSDDATAHSSMERVVLTNNSMEGNQYNFGFYTDDNDYMHSIDTSNTVDGKPIYYLLNATGNPEGDFADAGLIYAVNCTRLNIHDLTLSNNGYGIYFRNTTSSTITDVTTSENDDSGINLRYSSNNSIRGCETTESYNGISLTGSSDNSITACTASDNEYCGIYLESASDYCSISTCNVSENGRFGILLMKVSENSILRCDALENRFGIYFYNSADSFLSACTATENTYGIYSQFSSNIMIENCTVMNSELYGISVCISEHCTLTGNAMDGNTYNLRAEGSEDKEHPHSIDKSNTVNGKPVYYLLNATKNPEGNFTDAGTIYAINCTGLDIHDLSFSDTYQSVRMENCTGIAIHNLTNSGNKCGISLQYCTGITIDTITSWDNDYDIILAEDRNCTVSNCIVSNNTWGPYLLRSENITLFLNSFANTTAREYGDSLKNYWNTPSALTYRYEENMTRHTSQMGNYWGAAYNGTDQNGDGIGDTPFTGDGFNDDYPLMEPLSAYAFVENTGSDDDNTGEHDVEATGNLKAGDSVDMQFRGTAVTDVIITAAENIDLMTLRIAPASDGPDGLNGPVYQYLEADLIYASNDAIAGADFTFTVPTVWLTAQGLTPADIVLWHYHDGAWVPLPTEILSEMKDPIVYRALSPGFSYFAIGGGENGGSQQPVEITPSSVTEVKKGAVAVTTPQPAVPLETESEAAAATATPPLQSPAGIIPLLTGLGALALLFRRH